MGRPLSKKYFGNRNTGSASTLADNGIGGEGVASITLGSNNSEGYAANDPLIITAPDLPGGVQAVAKIATVDGDGMILTIEVTEKGSGYTSAPTVTENVGGVQGTTTFTAVLTTDAGPVGSSTNQENAIIAYAWIDGGREIADIVKQTAARRYTVRGVDGLSAKAKLVSHASSADGQVDITATDDEGKEYWVTKLTAHKALLTRKDGSGGYVYATGQTAPWTFTTTANGRVIIQNA